MNEHLRILRLNFWKWVQKFDHKDLQILELGSPGTSWFWQLVQALCGILFYSAWQGLTSTSVAILCHLPEKAKKGTEELVD